jgi:hypothetical protein
MALLLTKYILARALTEERCFDLIIHADYGRISSISLVLVRCVLAGEVGGTVLFEASDLPE